MYRLLLLLTCMASFAVNAQPKTDYSQLFKEQVGKKLQPLSSDHWKRDTTRNSDLALFLSKPQPGVHSLRQDNMPCLVPDPTATVAMPNAWHGKIEIPFQSNTPRIPNAANPLTITPSRPLLITPNTK